MMRVISYFVVISFAALTHQQNAVPKSPCPNVLTYEPATEVGRWYGVVNLSTDNTLHSLWLNIVLDSKADILGNWVGDVSTSDNIDFKIENPKMKIEPGPATEVRFFIQYNTLNKVPRVKAIRLNGREICNAQTPTPVIIVQETEPRPDTVRPDTIRPNTVRPDSGKFDTVRPDTVRPDTVRPGIVKIDSRPTNTQINSGQKTTSSSPAIVGPVYTPSQTVNERGDANPFSIGDGIIPAQNLGQQTSHGTQTGNSVASIVRPDGNTGTYLGSSTTTSANIGFQYGNAGTDTGKNVYSGNTGLGSGGTGVGFGTGNINTPSRPDIVYPTLTTTQPPIYTRPSTSVIDDYSESRPHQSADYFEGPRPVIPIPSSGSSSSSECGKVLKNNPNPLVVNGKPTLEGQWPWQIALYQFRGVDNKYICGGTLVSHRHVITAAHCVTLKGSNSIVNKDTLTVYLGKYNLRLSSDGVQIRSVGEIIVHPNYNATSFSLDSSVLRLREEVRYTDWVRPACLWPDDQVDLSYIVGKKGSIVGWGFDSTGVATEELTLVEMPVVSQETCLRSYSEFFARFTSEYTYCAGARDGSSVCNGDSGGGMVFNMHNTWYLRGLVSLSVARNTDRCDPNHYVVFTDLAKFLPWIKTIISN